MSLAVDPRLRVVAEREVNSRMWIFYLINDGGTMIESCDLAAVSYEWGDQYVGGESPIVHLANLGPGARALIWRDDGSSEMRTDLWLRVTHQGLQGWLVFEFPRLYRQTGTRLVAHPTRMQGQPAGIP